MVIERKRFVAGAKCPECKAMDTIMLFFEDDIEKLECIECGYTESQDDLKVESGISTDDTVIGVFKPE